MDRPYEVTTGTRRAFDGKLLRVRVDDVRLPSGRESVREVVEHPGSAVIVPVTTDDHILLIRQYRHATGQMLLELPAGLIDEGEAALATAARELREEVGYVAASLRELATVFVSPGYSEEQTTIVLAEGCTPVDHEPDEDEPIDLVQRPVAAIPAMLDAGEIGDAQALIGLLWLARLRGV